MGGPATLGGPGDVAPDLASQLLRAVGQAVVATDLEGRILYWNRPAERLYGWAADEALGESIFERVVVVGFDGDASEYEQPLSWVGSEARRMDEVEIERKDGDRLWIRTVRTPFLDATGQVSGVIGIAHDASVRREHERALRESETRFKALVQRSSDVAVIVEIGGTITFVSPGVVDLLGFQPDQLVGTSGWDVVHPDDLDDLRAALYPIAKEPGSHGLVEYRIRTADGSYRWVEETVSNMVDEPAVGGIVANIRDVGDRKRMESDLSHRALHDDLTGLPNRAHLDRALDAALNASEGVAVLVLDVDQFKLINDSHGHAVGDDLLRQMSARLDHALRPGDVAGRFGGDEFVVVCRDITAVHQAEQIAERLRASLQSPFNLHGVGPVFVSASVGIAAGLSGSTTAAELFHDADAAMYEAKRSGRGRHAVYDDAMRARASRRLRTESDLRQALDSGQIRAHFQPIVDVATGAMIGAEALARWYHPTRGLLGPAEFIEVAEDSGLVIDLDRLILDQALEAVAAWGRAGHRVLVAVNLSGHQLSDPGLVPVVAAGLERWKVSPDRLSLEVTETAVLADSSRSVAVVRALSELGVNLALDDFGTGYSSLAYLKALPVSAVKIDRGFVAGVDVRADDRDIVAAIVHLANAFGRFLVAEGVETESQLAVLRELGCPFAQGFLWSPPVERARFEAMLDEESSDRVRATHS
jgi:diguanylate cyclase (GGDEF)-like protein/PAS domain S-box-containing protein